MRKCDYKVGWGQFEGPQRREAGTFLLCFLTVSITIQFMYPFVSVSSILFFTLFKTYGFPMIISSGMHIVTATLKRFLSVKNPIE